MSQLRAGVAKSEISTEDPRMIVTDPLFAKALVLDDGATRVAILAMDAVAIGGICDISDEFLPQLRGRIESELSIPGANVLVNASHTHTPGPMLSSIEQQAHPGRGMRGGELGEVTVGCGAGHEDRWIINRTLRTTDGRLTIRQANPARRMTRSRATDRPADRHPARGPRGWQPARWSTTLLPPAGRVPGNYDPNFPASPRGH